jgi:CHAT domain-containing protein/Tfp pilus assembly protein PilF
MLDWSKIRPTTLPIPLLAFVSFIPGLALTQLPAPVTHSQSNISEAKETERLNAYLQPGKLVSGQISPGGKVRFRLALLANQHARLLIVHHGIDVAVHFTATDSGEVLNPEESSTGKDGQQSLNVAADKDSSYWLEVASRYPKAAGGSYQIKLMDLGKSQESDLLLMKADTNYAEASRFYVQGDYFQAHELAEKARQLRQQALGKDNPEVAKCLDLLGQIADGKSKFADALGLYEQALALDEKAFGPDDLSVAEILDHLARTYTAVAKYDDALQTAQRALLIREKQLGESDFLVASSNQTLANVYEEKGEYAKGENLAARALESVSHSYGSNDLPYAKAEAVVAVNAMHSGTFTHAEELFVHASEIKRATSGENSLVFAESLHDLGLFYVLKRDNIRAEEFETRAMTLESKVLGPDHLKTSGPLNSLGLIHYRRNDFTIAEDLYHRSLAIKEKFLDPNHPWIGITINNLGLLYWQRDEYEKAKQCFLRALAIFEKSDGPESTAVAFDLGNLGIISKDTGDYKGAEEYYKRSLDILEKTSGPNNVAVEVTVESLGILYRDGHQYAKAEPMLLRALEITRASYGPEHPNVARIQRNLAHLYSASGNIRRALEAWQQAVAIEEKDLPLNLAAGSERQKRALFDSYRVNVDKIISFHVNLDPDDNEARDFALTTILQRKGRVLDVMGDNLEALRNRSNPEDRELLDHLREVTSKLAALVLSGPGKGSLSEHQKQVEKLTTQRESLENEIGHRSIGFYQSSTVVTLNAVRAALPDDTALIEYAIYRPYYPKEPTESSHEFGDARYIAYVITRTGDVRWKDLGSAKDIDAAVNALRGTLRDPETRNVAGLARALDEKIMRPVRLLTGNSHHLLIAPDGLLDLVPFEALKNETGHYLVERYLFTYLTTGRDLLRMQVAHPSQSEVTVVADPSFGDRESSTAGEPQSNGQKLAGARSVSRGRVTTASLDQTYFPPLKGTEAEARAIRNLFPQAHLLVQGEATKAALLKVQAPIILHIATHGFFLFDSKEEQTAMTGTGPSSGQSGQTPENPLLRSGLALTGANVNLHGRESGILTALEASNLNLWGTRLVTLSACDTGLGEVRVGEGVFGLRRAFVLSGTESLVMSLWPVSDYATRQMITAYYTGLKNGQGRGEALRKAELAMLKRKGWEHPYYWASFIEFGKWTSLDDAK